MPNNPNPNPNPYIEMRNRHWKELNDFPMFFAFSDAQFKESMAKFGLNPDKKSDLDQICRGPAGMFIRKSDAANLKNMMNRHKRELQDAISADKKGTKSGFMYQMFEYELFNHEYGYTGDPEETLNELGLSYKTLEDNPAMTKAFEMACKYVTRHTA